MNTDTTSTKRKNLERLLRPRHVAYIGGMAIEDGIRGCIEGGFQGPVWAVNPKYDSLGDQPCFKSIADLPEPPDATFISVPREATIDMVGALSAAGAGGAVCYAAGFSEIGEAGADHQAAIIDAAGDFAAMGPNCFGFVNFVDRVGLWPMGHADHTVEHGPAFIAQSGNVTLNLMYNMRSVPFSYMISCGNEAVIGTSDFIEVLLDDPRVTAIGLYIEAIRDVGRFSLAAARALDQGVPIVALKAGKSEAARRVAMTHTGSLSGSEEAYAALFERLAISRADSPALLLEKLKALSIVGPLDGNRITIFTCSGGEAALASDLADRNGMTLPQPTQAQYDKVREVLPDFANIVNPLDYNTSIWGQREPLEHVFTAMMSDGYDVALLVIDFLQGSGFEDTAYAAIESLIAANKTTGVPAFHTCSLSESVNADAQAMMIEAGVGPLQGLDHAIAAIGAAVAYGKRRREILDSGGTDAVLLPAAYAAPDEANTLDEYESKQRLAEFGLTVPAGQVTTTATAPNIADAVGYPVVVKALSAALHHKSEAGAVHLGLTDADAVRGAVTAMNTALGIDRFLVEPMINDGVCELIVGVTRDPALGMVLVVGGGGVLVEAVRDNAALLLPTNRAAVAGAIAGLKAATLLAGYRGKPAGDIDAAIDAVLAVADFAEANRDRLAELDVNPLIVRPQGHGTIAVDALISIAD
ncbi:MAG: acetate--CoA ligase family protein [Alphaproteobacteria bacterium]